MNPVRGRASFGIPPEYAQMHAARKDFVPGAKKYISHAIRSKTRRQKKMGDSMKKFLILLLAAMLLLSSSALAYYDPNTGARVDSPYTMYARLNQRMATRTGPGTQYTEPGTFFSAGDMVKLISYTTDASGVKWVQAEIDVRGSLMRVYTGLKRFDGVNLNQLCRERRLNVVAFLDTDITPTYGPGWQYANCDFTLRRGSEVLVLDSENGYDICEFYINGKLYRAWIPDSGMIPKR